MPSATITQSRRESGNSLTNAAIVIIVGVLPTTLALLRLTLSRCPQYCGSPRPCQPSPT
jgi:hypothetical protein